MTDTDDRISPGDRRALYAARSYLPLSVEKNTGVRIHFDTYFDDPAVAAKNADLGRNPDFHVLWEPGIDAGPTSARFAVVDYDADLAKLRAPVKWDSSQSQFLTGDGAVVDWSKRGTDEFRQVHVWALLQDALEFYEGAFGLGRSIPWGFDGNRLIVVPSAGYAENAFYDRGSKSLQFYYFDDPDTVGGKVYTSLSSDIVRHEFGHAVLDGIRPHFIEALSPETAAFHEFLGDMTAILIAFRNNPFRKQVAEDTDGDLTIDNMLASIASQFGSAIQDKPYLRTGLNSKTMQDVAGSTRPHFISQVLTGAIFDIIIALVDHYRTVRKQSLLQAFWNTIQRIQRMAVQPLDLLPPMDVTFADYARAMLRAEEISNPVDPHDIRELLFKAFVNRGILPEAERADLLAEKYVFDRPNLTVFHEMNSVARSKAEAYRFLNDNRRDFLIPHNQDVVVSDLYACRKLGRQGRRLPEQICILYTWRETVELNDPRFGRFNGQSTSMLCGGTLVFDENGSLLSWSRKPGAVPVRTKRGKMAELAELDAIAGQARRQTLLDNLGRRIAMGQIGDLPVGAKGFISSKVPPLIARQTAAGLRFELTPHLGIHSEDTELPGGRIWQISS